MSDTPIPPDVEAFATRAFALVDDPRLLFDSEGTRNAIFFTRLKAKAKAWETPRPCMYRGCANVSIAKSHAIQRAGPISHLLEDGHVLTPRFENGGLRMKPIGASSASTFPGFCSEHELIFQAFETKAVIETDEAVRLQTFRTICRELRRKHYEIEVLEEDLTHMRHHLDQKMKTEALRYGVKFKRVEANDGVYAMVQSRLDAAKASARTLEQLYDAHFPAIDMSGSSRLVGKAFQTNLAFPVALSGFVEFKFNGRELLCVLSVLPQAGGTLIYMVGMPNARRAIEACLRLANYDLPLIDIVETWMVRATDHWFLRPSAWEALPEDRRQAILGEILDTSKGLGIGCSLSIFDDLRRAALAIPQAPDQSQSVRQYIADQRTKIS